MSDGKPTGICEECGKEYRKNTPRQRFCDGTCSRRWNARHRRRKRKKQKEKGRIVACLHCGKEFRSSGAVYCSAECRNEAAKERDRQRLGEENCQICGKRFVKRCKSQIYCSKVCNNIAKRKDYADSMKREHIPIRIRVLKDIPVYAYLRPAVGEELDATEFLLIGGVKECWIESHGKRVILRKDEYVRIA